MKKLISERALMQRINRRLPEHEILKKARASSRWLTDLGAYYIVDENHNVIVASDQDLLELATELGAIKGYEKLDGE